MEVAVGGGVAVGSSVGVGGTAVADGSVVGSTVSVRTTVSWVISSVAGGLVGETVSAASDDPHAAKIKINIKIKSVRVKIFIKTLDKSTVAHYRW